MPYFLSLDTQRRPSKYWRKIAENRAAGKENSFNILLKCNTSPFSSQQRASVDQNNLGPGDCAFLAAADANKKQNLPPSIAFSFCSFTCSHCFTSSYCPFVCLTSIECLSSAGLGELRAAMMRFEEIVHSRYLCSKMRL